MNHAKEELDMEKIGLSAIALLLCGCSAAGVVISNDPWQNLAQADVLIEHGRATAAEKLIVEARNLCKEDAVCHAMADREYALLLLSSSVGSTWAEHYKEQGFIDQTVNLQNRTIKAAAYLEQAATQLNTTTAYDKLSNVQLLKASVYQELQDQKSTCSSLAQALTAYQDNLRHNPGAAQQGVDGYASLGDYIIARQKAVRCM
ncbi:hypothetical protein [Aeromonas veronii]|uniref:hypothetical protein n=1 Tax=Aeromonas veronii TaxID=654 RepID=UPI002B46B8B2|nr:hypothetical protein [Aeromonas veronii]